MAENLKGDTIKLQAQNVKVKIRNFKVESPKIDAADKQGNVFDDVRAQIEQKFSITTGARKVTTRERRVHEENAAEKKN